MKKIILIILTITIFTSMYAQKKPSNFKSWSIGLYGGTNWQVGSELASLSEPNPKLWNYIISADVTKYISHAVGFDFKFNVGKSFGNAPYGNEYFSNVNNFNFYSLGTELKLSSMFRRQDRSKLAYKWGFLANAGFGVTSYKSTRYRNDKLDQVNPNPYKSTGDGKSIFRSLFAYVGAEVRYNLNKNLDLGFKPTFYFTTDGQWDNCGGIGAPCPVEQNQGENDDNLLAFELGLRYKIGPKSQEHLEWVMPNYEQDSKLEDTDGDGVADIFDVEPDTPLGIKVYGNGSSLDIDKDGIPDYKDDCSAVPGLPELNGCPGRGDKDNDGIFDDEDECPNTPGDPENEGCPINGCGPMSYLFDRILFDSGKYTIKSVSFQDLEELAKLLKDAPDSKWYVDGHSDNVGDEKKNIIMSRKRAETVYEELIKRGVQRNQLSVRAFGSSKPRDTNETAFGRQMNRRVELTIVE